MHGRLGGWTRRAALALLVLIACQLLVADQVDAHPELGLFDEWVYSDALHEASQGGVIQRGELIEDYSLELSSCRGMGPSGPVGSPCGGPYVSQIYPQFGLTSADIHPPTYFLLTAALARGYLALGVTDDLLTAGRLSGAIWLAAGLLVLAALARELGADPFVTALLCLGIAVSPLVRTSNSYVTPDALNLLIGAALVLAVVRWASGRGHLLVVMAAAAAGVAVKVQNVLVVGCVVLALIGWAAVRLLRQRPGNPGDPDTADTRRGAATVVRSTRSLLVAAAALVLTVVAAEAAWLVVRQLIAVGPSPAQSVEPVIISLDLLLLETTAFARRLAVGPVEDGLAIPVYAELFAWLLIGGLGAAVARTRAWSREHVLACAALAALLLGSPALLVLQQLAFGSAIASPTRYGMSLLPVYVAVAALGLSRGPAARHRTAGPRSDPAVVPPGDPVASDICPSDAPHGEPPHPAGHRSAGRPVARR